MNLEINRMSELPQLAWIARIERNLIRAEVGSAVEVGPDMLVEGVWDGPFEAGAFHQSDAFFGSGIRVEGGRVFIVPSNSVTDRVLFRQIKQRFVVSNSLPLLLGRTGIRLDKYYDYTFVGYAIGKGIYQYEDVIPVKGSNTPIRQLYHRMLIIEQGECTRADRTAVRDFRNFSDYYTGLKKVVMRIAQNASSDRRHEKMEVFSTMSSGYDSPCASVFARHAGANRCFAARYSNSLYPKFLNVDAKRDEGREIASTLDLELIRLPEKPSWREIYFRSASCIPPELALDGIADALEDEIGVLFTGYYGDTVWGLTPPEETDSSLRWPLPSGVSLSEARLVCGFINLALPFIYGRSRRSIAEISASDEMTPWRIGGSYDRPIPRRIVEEAGVERGAFGMHKKRILNHRTEPVHPEVRKAYLAWVSENFHWNKVSYRAQVIADAATYYAISLLYKIQEILLDAEARNCEHEPLWKEASPHDMMFRWAANRLADHWEEW